MYWCICKTLHVLPTDPAFQKLSAVQMLWLWQNIAKDVEITTELKDDKTGSMSVIKSDPDLIKQKLAEYKEKFKNAAK